MPDQNEVNEFLDALRESGAVNMFGAAVYIQGEFSLLSSSEAKEFLMEWMRTFSERQPVAQPRRIERDGLFMEGA